MKRGIELFFLIFIFSMFIRDGYASSVVEPYIGYLHGEYNSRSDATKHQYDSLGFGSRIGYRNTGFDLGMDLTFSLSTMEQRLPIASDPPKTDYFTWGLGPYIGYQFPILLRVWITYYLYNSFSSRAGPRSDTLSGNGYGIGAGYQLSFIPNIDVFANLELRRISISKVEADSSISRVDNPINELFLSISVPIEF